MSTASQGKSKTGGQTPVRTSLGEKNQFGLHLSTIFILTSAFILSETGAQQAIIYINNAVLNFCLCYLTYLLMHNLHVLSSPGLFQLWKALSIDFSHPLHLLKEPGGRGREEMSRPIMFSSTSISD
jgi:hypothetical protein